MGSGPTQTIPEVSVIVSDPVHCVVTQHRVLHACFYSEAGNHGEKHPFPQKKEPLMMHKAWVSGPRVVAVNWSMDMSTFRAQQALEALTSVCPQGRAWEVENSQPDACLRRSQIPHFHSLSLKSFPAANP